MKKFARLICLCLLVVFATETFAKSVDPVAHASASAQARLMLDALKDRMLVKFSRASVSQQESILYGMYRMGVRVQNKLQKMDLDKVARKINRLTQNSEESQSVAQSEDEAVAAEFIGDVAPVAPAPQVEVNGADVRGILDASAEAFRDLGTVTDVKGNLKALSKASFLDSVRVQYGDGDMGSQLGDALAALFTFVIIVLAVAAVAIVGLSAIAFGLPGALVAVGLIGVAVIVFMRS